MMFFQPVQIYFSIYAEYLYYNIVWLSIFYLCNFCSKYICLSSSNLLCLLRHILAYTINITYLFNIFCYKNRVDAAQADLPYDENHVNELCQTPGRPPEGWWPCCKRSIKWLGVCHIAAFSSLAEFVLSRYLKINLKYSSFTSGLHHFSLNNVHWVPN